ncbi:MAG: hypothetical protein R2883_08750 [Caldisericia bacterium]
MRGIWISLVLVFFSLGCGNGETTLPVISSCDYCISVVSGIGDKFSDFTEFSYTRYDNSIVDYKPENNNLLIFWRYGCESCRAELDYIEDFVAKYDTELLVICINDVDSVPIVMDVLHEMDPSFEVVFDPSGALRVPYQVSSVPDSIYFSAMAI